MLSQSAFLLLVCEAVTLRLYILYRYGDIIAFFLASGQFDARYAVRKELL